MTGAAWIFLGIIWSAIIVTIGVSMKTILKNQ